MQLISFKQNGNASYGVLNGGDITDLGARLGAGCPDLKSLLEQGSLPGHPRCSSTA